MHRFLYLLFVFPSLSFAQKSLLWKVTSKDLDHTSYLFGSMHTNDSLLNTFDTNWWYAFNSCQMFAGEVNASDTSAMMEAFNAGLMKDTTLSDLYTEEDMTKVRTFILSKVDFATGMMLMRLKPFYVMALLIQLPDKSGPYTEVMDLRLQRIAAESGMTIIGLESGQEQAASVGALNLKEQATMLLEYLENHEKTMFELEQLEMYYRHQDLTGMLEFSGNNQPIGTSKAMMEALVDMRNNRFLDRLLVKLDENSVFCVVGALHLPGNSGLINQLRLRGYKVEPVEFKFGE